ncbi:MAG: HU family DNA-binding protein [Planctomycetes bacterium]|nr:HU family DNA-binding protein [Planctomycetota bacterium]MBI3847910.1 HU family DNA-binding protein [Planctomycetota bacterium]
MNKQELFESVAGELSTSKAQGEKIVNAVFKSIQTGLKKDKAVQLVGFGTFSVRNRKARIGRNPQTGAEIKIKPSRTVGFKAGKSLKSSL